MPKILYCSSLVLACFTFSSAPEATGDAAWFVGIVITMLIFQMEAHPVHLFKQIVVFKVYDHGSAASLAQFGAVG